MDFEESPLRAHSGLADPAVRKLTRAEVLADASGTEATFQLIDLLVKRLGSARAFLLESAHERLGVAVCTHVYRNTPPVLLVARDPDGSWQLLCGDGHDEGVGPEIVHLRHFLDADPSLTEVLELAPGFEAERDKVCGRWQTRPSAAE